MEVSWRGKSFTSPFYSYFILVSLIWNHFVYLFIYILVKEINALNKNKLKYQLFFFSILKILGINLEDKLLFAKYNHATCLIFIQILLPSTQIIIICVSLCVLLLANNTKCVGTMCKRFVAAKLIQLSLCKKKH